LSCESISARQVFHWHKSFHLITEQQRQEAGPAVGTSLERGLLCIGAEQRAFTPSEQPSETPIKGDQMLAELQNGR
jgi:hypothetical protein